MPVPRKVSFGKGIFQLHAGDSFSVHGPQDDRVVSAIARFSEWALKNVGLRIPATPGPDGKLVIQLRKPGLRVQSQDEDESYRLDVTRKAVHIRAENPLGVLHALETLKQLTGADGKIRTARVEDAPRFRWRGLLVDVARHYQPISVLKRTLDGMAAVKLNVLHLHLTDDQGFRVESKIYPDLTRLGSNGRFYSQKELRDLIDYARKRGIRIVPEFDMPGHVTSWFAGLPNLASAPGHSQPETGFGVFDALIDPSREETYEALRPFLAEMASLFPDEVMHIGGDEVNGKEWLGNASIANFMQGQGLQGPEELERYFTSRLEQLLAKNSKRAMGWEIASSKVSKKAIVQAWQKLDALTEAAEAGFDTVLSYGYYLDLALPAWTHYSVDPIPEDLSDEAEKHILGGEACLWTELVSPRNFDSRLWPRAAAIAERFWSPEEVRDRADMYRRLEIESRRLSALGLEHLSSPAAKLAELAAKEQVPAAALQTLSTALEPAKFYVRENSAPYTTASPLDRVVDAVPPESDSARDFADDVASWLASGRGSGVAFTLKARLQDWRDTSTIISQSTGELAPVAEQTRALSEIGLEALKELTGVARHDPIWVQESLVELNTASEVQAELEQALVPAIRELVLSTGSAMRYFEGVDTTRLAP